MTRTSQHPGALRCIVDSKREPQIVVAELNCAQTRAVDAVAPQLLCRVRRARHTESAQPVRTRRGSPGSSFHTHTHTNTDHRRHELGAPVRHIFGRPVCELRLGFYPGGRRRRHWPQRDGISASAWSKQRGREAESETHTKTGEREREREREREKERERLDLAGAAAAAVHRTPPAPPAAVVSRPSAPP